MPLTVIFSLGAVIGAMITMYSAVANRTAEIGTLRALGLQRGSILAAFLMEFLLLGLVGGCIGLFFTSFLQLFTISTLNFQTFSELPSVLPLPLKSSTSPFFFHSSWVLSAGCCRPFARRGRILLRRCG
jgi:ABC-type antimicrobial peptide transport system permease subunit